VRLPPYLIMRLPLVSRNFQNVRQRLKKLSLRESKKIKNQ